MTKQKTVIITILSLLIFVNLFSQTLDDIHDLGFKRASNEHRWSWVRYARGVEFTTDSSTTICGKYPLKISTKAYSDFYFLSDAGFSLLRVIPLPYIVEDNSVCCVTINSKNEIKGNCIFSVAGFDKDENIIFNDSVPITNKEWGNNVITFSVNNIIAIGVSITYSGEISDKTQNMWIDRVSIDIDEQSINSYPVPEAKGNLRLELSERNITSLSFDNDSLVLNIPDIKNKKIIGLGESSHGSIEIKTACYQFMKALILYDNTKLILLERAPDMCLKWDLYIQGLISSGFEENILEDIKCHFDDSILFLDFLKWLRKYNETVNSKVHIFGFDRFADKQSYLSEYFRLLMGDAIPVCYLQKIEQEEYQEITNNILNDYFLQTKLDYQSLNYLIYLLNDSAATINTDFSNREYNMWKRTDKIISSYLGENEKAIVYAHSDHTSKLQKFFTSNFKSPSLGTYINKKYGSDYFSITFQIGEGEYTQDENGEFGTTISQKLKSPPYNSFEKISLDTEVDYFYYPADKLPENITYLRMLLRTGRYLDQFYFCSIRKCFDGLVFIKNSSRLNHIESYPYFYMGSLMQAKRIKRREVLNNLEEKLAF